MVKKDLLSKISSHCYTHCSSLAAAAGAGVLLLPSVDVGGGEAGARPVFGFLAGRGDSFLMLVLHTQQVEWLVSHVEMHSAWNVCSASTNVQSTCHIGHQ